MHSFITRSLVVATLTLAIVALWSSAVRAETWLEGPCTARPMAQGTVGEWVTTCSLTRIGEPSREAAQRRTTATSTVTANASKPKAHHAKAAQRTGRTVVVARLGARQPAPTASFTMPPLVVTPRTSPVL